MSKIMILIGLTFVLICSGCVDHSTTPDNDTKPDSDITPDNDTKPDSDITPDNDTRPDSDITPDNDTSPYTENITFVTIAHGDRSGYQYGMDVMGDDPMALIITDIGEWNKSHKYLVYTPPTPDFENDLAIAVFRGNKPASGYDIHIENITRSNNMMTVMVYMSEHSPGHGYTQMETSPYCIATVKKTDMIEQKENIKFIFYNDEKELILSYNNGSYVLPDIPTE